MTSAVRPPPAHVPPPQNIHRAPPPSSSRLAEDALGILEGAARASQSTSSSSSSPALGQQELGPSPQQAERLLRQGLAEACSSPLMTRQQVREKARFNRPLGVYFLARAKGIWVSSVRTVNPYMPNHDCMETLEDGSGGCTRVQIEMRVYARDPLTEESLRQAHICLRDRKYRTYLCDRKEDAELHRKEYVVIDHPELHFCLLTGRLHLCGEGICFLAQTRFNHSDGYQAVCPITGIAACNRDGVLIGSEFWRAGRRIGQGSGGGGGNLGSAFSITQQNQRHYSSSADDLTRLMDMLAESHAELLSTNTSSSSSSSTLEPTTVPAIAKTEPNEGSLAVEGKIKKGPRKRTGKHRELDRFIAARHETGFVHRKKLESRVWLDWAQKFAEWDLWLDMLCSMDSFQKIAEHLRDITQESYRRVWGLKGLIKRYAAAMVYVAFCPERYMHERKAMAEEITQSVKRLTSSMSSSGGDKPMIFSQLVDAAMGALTRTRRGDVYSDVRPTMALTMGDKGQQLSLTSGKDGDGPPGEDVSSKSRGTIVAFDPETQDPRGRAMGQMRAQIEFYTNRVVQLWVIVNESCAPLVVAGSTGEASSPVEFFPLSHFVFGALDCFADGLCVTLNASDVGMAGGTMPWFAVPPDGEMKRHLPKEWDFVGSGLYSHGHCKIVQSNIAYAITSAMQSGRMPRDFIMTYTREWSDLKLETMPWIADLPNKSIFRPPPKKLAFVNTQTSAGRIVA